VEITRQNVPVHTGSPDQDGCLLFADGRLVAVLVRLSGEHDPELVGKWFLEHGFGRLDAPEQPVFDDLDVAQRWVILRLA